MMGLPGQLPGQYAPPPAYGTPYATMPPGAATAGMQMPGMPTPGMPAPGMPAPGIALTAAGAPTMMPFGAAPGAAAYPGQPAPATGQPVLDAGQAMPPQGLPGYPGQQALVAFMAEYLS